MKIVFIWNYERTLRDVCFGGRPRCSLSFWAKLGTVLVFAACLFFNAFPLQAQSEARPETQIERIGVEEINPDFVRIAVYASLVSQTKVEVRELTLENLKLNGLSVYASPFIGRWTLPANIRTSLPKPLSVKIYLRDLDSTAPLQQLLSTSRIVVAGSARINFSLGLIQQFFLLSRTATASVAFRTEVPMALPAPGPLRETAAILLGLGSPILETARSGLEAARDLVSRWRQDLKTNYAPLLVHVRSSYILQNQSGEKLPMAFECNGFRISKSGFIVPLESLEPWTFDPHIAAAIKTKSVSVVRASSDLEVWSLASS